MGRKEKLTAKQENFCYEWFKDYNATQAAIRSGYSKKSAKVIGSENLTKPDIQARIKEIREELIKNAGITPAMILAEYAKIAFSEMEDYSEVRSGSVRVKDTADIAEHKRGVIKELKEDKDGNLSIKLHDKKPALDKLAEYHEMFKASDNPTDIEINVKFDE